MKTSKVVILTISTVFSIIIFSYFWVFILEKKIDNNGLIAIRLVNQDMEIILHDSFHYITKVDTVNNMDTLNVSLYFTTVANFFNKSRKTGVFIMRKNYKYIKINDKIINIDCLDSHYKNVSLFK